MPVRIERLHGDAHILRVYEADDGSAHPPYVASAVLEWVDARTAWIKALQGSLTRSLLRELLQLLVDRGVHVILAERADGHGLPFGELGHDGVIRIRVQDLAHRLARRD